MTELGVEAEAAAGSGQDLGGVDSQAARARAEALEHARAARLAAARYARLAPQASAPSRNLLTGLEDAMFSEASDQTRIYRTELALAGTAVMGQVQRLYLNDLRRPGHRVGGAFACWLPLMLLKPTKRGTGVGAIVKDPRVASLGLMALLAVAKEVDVNSQKPSKPGSGTPTGEDVGASAADDADDGGSAGQGDLPQPEQAQTRRAQTNKASTVAATADKGEG